MVLRAFVPVVLSLATLQAQDTTGESVYRKVADSVVLLVVENSSHETIGQGSGFIIDDGRIVTNAHVARAGNVFVKSGVFKSSCAVERIDDLNDLALLMPSTPLAVRPLSFASGTPLSGARVFAVGNPRGMEKTITEGLVTGVRSVDGSDVLQISAAISPGSSGGPVVDTDGAVVGVAVAGLRNAQNVNFAVPLPALQALLRSTASTDLSGLLATIARTEKQKKTTEWSVEEDSAWMKAEKQEKQLFQTALSISSSVADILKVFDAAIEAGDEIALDAATKAFSMTKTARTYAAVARAAQAKAQGLAFASDSAEERSKLLGQGVDAATRAVSLAPTAENFYLLADVQEDAGQTDGALTNFSRAFTGNLSEEAHWNALRGMLRTARTAARTSNVAAWFKTLVSSGHITDLDWLQQAKFLDAQGMYSDAAAIYEQLVGHPQQQRYILPVQIWNSAALDRLISDDYDSALRDARNCIAAGTSAKDSTKLLAGCNYIIANVLNNRGVYDQAISAAKEAISLNPEIWGPYLVLSESLNSLERHAEAEAAAKRALAISDGKNASVHFALGSAYFSEEKWGLAKQAFENAARIDPKDAGAAYNVAASLYNDHFYTEAIFWYEETLRRDPAHKDRAQILTTIDRLKRR